MDITPKFILSGKVQAWFAVLTFLLVLVVVYDNYTGKKLLSFLFPTKTA